jgi:hypothetical protein
MIAVQLAIHTWRYDRIVLAGIPLNNGYEHYVEYWKPLVETHGHMIRSMSGNTAHLFGRPDDDFVHGAAVTPPLNTDRPHSSGGNQ